MFHNREMSVLRTDLDLDLDPDDLRMGGWDREAVQLLFQQLEFRLLYPRLLEALGEVGEEAPKGETLDASVRSLRSTDEIVKHLHALTDAGKRYAIEPRWDNDATRTALQGLAFTGSTEDAVYLHVDDLRDASVTAELAALLGA